MSTPQRVPPRTQVHTLVLDLSSSDAAFTAPLFAQLLLLAPDNSTGTAILTLGGAPLPFAMARDASVAVPRPNTVPSATSLSSTSSHSHSLSIRLAKRYARQFFLSLDLSSLGPEGDRALGAMEKALVVELDKVLERPGRIA
ncbi:hypothetical protein JCM8097_008098 [Rhodosporidiobolus ruineniae]